MGVQLETGRWSKEDYFKVWRVMRLGSYNTIGRELLASSDMFLQNDGSHNLDMKSTVSLPPPYKMVVEEKERLAMAAGLPPYKEACPDHLDSLGSLDPRDSLGQDSNSLCLDSSGS